MAGLVADGVFDVICVLELDLDVDGATVGVLVLDGRLVVVELDVVVYSSQ